MSFTDSGPLADLIERLQRLPTVGQKTAQRLAFYLLKAPPSEAQELADAILEVRRRIKPCGQCNLLTDNDPCMYCTDSNRDDSILCIVEEGHDLATIERTSHFRGRYHVLGGSISPLDGIGPAELNLGQLERRVREGEFQEVIVATNPTVEGEATAAYLARLLRPTGVRVTRIAAGIPVGGDIEYVDEVTMSRSLEGRREI